MKGRGRKRRKGSSNTTQGREARALFHYSFASPDGHVTRSSSRAGVGSAGLERRVRKWGVQAKGMRKTRHGEGG